MHAVDNVVVAIRALCFAKDAVEAITTHLTTRTTIGSFRCEFWTLAQLSRSTELSLSTGYYYGVCDRSASKNGGLWFRGNTCENILYL